MRVELKKNSDINFHFETEVWAKVALPTLAATKSYIEHGRKKSKDRPELLIDFSDTYWAEVPVLLALAAFSNQAACNFEVVIKFGKIRAEGPRNLKSTGETDGRPLVFLSFLRSMGFFKSLPKSTKIEIAPSQQNSDNHLMKLSVPEFECLLQGITTKAIIQAVTLSHIFVGNINDFIVSNEDRSLDGGKLKLLLTRISENAALNIDSAGLNKGTIWRQQILLSIDKLLQESLANIVEHAYKDIPEGGFFAFYARIRNPNSTFKGEFEKGLYDSTDEWDHSREVNWTELYVCDLGVGLESQIEPWLHTESQKEPQNKSLISQLANASKKTNTFLAVSRLLFDNSLSRHSERSFSRSPETGLQDLRRVLSDVGYVDITNCLFSNRRRFNAKPDDGNVTYRQVFSEAKSPPFIKDAERDAILAQFPDCQGALSFSLGTQLIFRTQVRTDLPLKGQRGYRSLDFKQAAAVLQAYKAESGAPESYVYFDKRFSESSQPSPSDLLGLIRFVQKARVSSEITICVRFSRSPYKNDVNEWLQLRGHQLHGKELGSAISKRRVNINIFFVDVLPIHAGWLIERVKSYSATAWAMSTGLNKIGIFTNMFHFALLDRTSTGYKIDSKLSQPLTTDLVNVTATLREMDSHAFWANYRNYPILDSYLNSDVNWLVTKRKIGEKFKNEIVDIEGYLDFATSLQCLQRYRVCERSLLRFMAILFSLNNIQKNPESVQFIAKLISSDSMTDRLARSVNSLFGEIGNHNDEAAVILSSVIVTGQTQERAAIKSSHSSDKISETMVSFFNRAKAKQGSEKMDYTLLKWLPPKSTLEKKSGRIERIFRTSEVSPQGGRDIRIPHVIEIDGKKVDNYQRDRTGTYADFEQLGALQFGHLVKSNRHELMNLNLNALIPLIIATNHVSWGWLVSKFYDPKRDCDCSVIIIYPNQTHAEQIVQEVQHRESSRLPSESVTFISAPFLKSRSAEPIISSPRLEQRLTETVRMILKKRESRNVKNPIIKIRIFDTGVVSGRTMKAIKHQIENVLESGEKVKGSFGARLGPKAPIETISLIDRSGYPVYGELLKSYSKTNHRFWRWDMPSLTETGTCRICSAKDSLKDYRRLRELALGQRYANEYDRLPIDLFDQIERHSAPEKGDGDFSTDFLGDIQMHILPLDLQEVIFGYYGKIPNKIGLSSTHQYISIFAELTRLLHRSDITLNRSMELAQLPKLREGNIDCLIILMLASHILLFHQTFDTFERTSYAVELFGMMVEFEADWESPDIRTLANAYGMLALYSIEDSDLRILRGPRYFCFWLNERKILNPFITAYIKHISLEEIAFPFEVEQAGSQTQVWRENLDSLRNNPSMVIEKIMDIVGDQRIWHRSKIYRRLSQAGITHELLQADFSVLLSLITEAHDRRILHLESLLVEKIREQAANSSLAKLSGSEKSALIESIDSVGNSLRSSLFSAVVPLGKAINDGSPTWSHKQTVKKFLELSVSDEAKKGSKFDKFVEQLNGAIKNESNSDYVNDLFDYIGIGRNCVNLPFENCVSFFPSDYVRLVVDNVLLNSRHSSQEFIDPTNPDGSIENGKYSWIWLGAYNNLLVLNMATFCTQDPKCESLYKTRFPEFWAEGNYLECRYDNQTKTLTTQIFLRVIKRKS